MSYEPNLVVSHLDKIDRDCILECLDCVIDWQVYPMQLNTVRRRETALKYRERLEAGLDGQVDRARRFLKSVASNEEQAVEFLVVK